MNFRRRNLPEGITRFRFVFPVARENLFSVRDVTRKAVFNCVFIIPHFCRFVNRKTNKSSYFFKNVRRLGGGIKKYRKKGKVLSFLTIYYGNHEKYIV